MPTNVEIIQGWYESHDRSSLAPDAEWIITEGFPAGGRYVGQAEIYEQFFPSLHQSFSEFNSDVNEILDARDVIVVLGYYSGQTKLTGVTFTSPFAHIWKLTDGKIVQFRQYVDTVLIKQALSASSVASAS